MLMRILIIGGHDDDSLIEKILRIFGVFWMTVIAPLMATIFLFLSLFKGLGWQWFWVTLISWPILYLCILVIYRYLRKIRLA